MIYPTVLSGGTGTRLWPMSRSHYPKQLLPLFGDGGTLLQQTVLRVADPDRFAPPLVVANEEHRFIVAEQLGDIGVETAGLILEPVGRNTAPAAAVAALHLAEQDPNALILLMPSDHTIGDVVAFQDAIKKATVAAASGHLVTFGITPERVETGYGYMARGPRLPKCDSVFALSGFIEKPPAAEAERLVAAGTYFWNSGIFLFRVSTYLAELERLQPNMLAACRAALGEARRDADFIRLDKPAFERCPNISIDYAVMEHTESGAVVPATMAWNDLGSWDALWQVSDKDEAGNALTGNVVSEDSRNCYLRCNAGMLLATIGVDDLVVVATDDVVMVAPRTRAQEVKQLVGRLREDGRGEVDALPTVHRPWGSYKGLHAGHRVQVKHIVVKPGGKLSLQLHHHRAEHWVVVQGTAKIVRGNEEMILTENQSTYIPLGTQHRLENPGKIPLHLIEVQSGSYLGEDDIIRFDDHYGRA